MTSGKETVCAVFAETEKYVPGSCYKHSDVCIGTGTDLGFIKSNTNQKEANSQTLSETD